jgi:hypothetical protein
MCKDVKITAEQLTKAMDAEYQKPVKQVEDAVNQAPDRAVISGSEELVRDAMARFRYPGVRQRSCIAGLRLRFGLTPALHLGRSDSLKNMDSGSACAGQAGIYPLPYGRGL